MESLYQSLRTALAQPDEQQHIPQLVFFLSLKFSVPSDSLSVSSIFYSLAAEAWGDRGHVAFQVTFKSN